MKIAVVLNLVALVTCTAYSLNFEEIIEEEWNLFKMRFKKVYRDVVEEQIRKKLYLHNRIKVAKHNKLYENGKVTYELGINQFSDWMKNEYFSMMKGIKPNLVHENENYTTVGAIPFFKSQNDIIPKSIDWSKKGYVTPVKNQGNCGSCWAFSATGALEGQHYRNTKVLTSLSEQNLIDCSGKYGNEGCEGGLMDYAFKYIYENKGIDTEKSYPYEAEDDRCRYNSKNAGATEKGFTDIPSGDEDSLMHAVASVGPVAVAVDASSEDFHAYRKGVYYDPDCSSNSLNHGMLVVGYDTDQEAGDYWIVKNSWDSTWGNHGYMWMARNKDNNCGIATMASYPVV